LAELNGVRKMEGYSNYYRIKLGEYRLGVKLEKSELELIRFLHRKDIYRRFP
jgi:mRNA interferase RelE/StbE